MRCGCTLAHLQSHWVGVEWQSAVSIIDLLLVGAQSETVCLFGTLATPMLNDLINSGDRFLTGIAAKLVQRIVRQDPGVLPRAGFDLSGLVRVLLEEDSPELVKNLVVFTIAKVPSHLKCHFDGTQLQVGTFLTVNVTLTICIAKGAACAVFRRLAALSLWQA